MPSLPHASSDDELGYLCAGCGRWVPLGDAVMVRTAPPVRLGELWFLVVHPECVADLVRRDEEYVARLREPVRRPERRRGHRARLLTITRRLQRRLKAGA